MTAVTQKGMSRLRAPRIVVAGLLLLLMGLGYTYVVDRGESSSAITEGRTIEPSNSTTAPDRSSLKPPTTGPAVPREGAYVGAWVEPRPYSQVGRIQSFQKFEQRIGRRMDIVHLYRRWSDPFPTVSDRQFASRAILQLSWAGVDTREIIAGRQDDVIRERARGIRQLGTPILLRWRWEMDRPNLNSVVHSPSDFIAAWRHIRRVFAEEKVSNVAWVWCPTAEGFATGRAPAYYPGDKQVDWVCADVYPEQPWVNRGYQPFAALAAPFLGWAANRPKPIVIGEFAVPETYGKRRGEWLGAMQREVRANPQIKALVYFEASAADDPAYYHWRIEDDPSAAKGFGDMARSPWFNVLNRGVP